MVNDITNSGEWCFECEHCFPLVNNRRVISQPCGRKHKCHFCEQSRLESQARAELDAEHQNN